MTIFMYYQILCFSFSLIYWFPKSGEYFLGKRSEFFFLEYIFLQNSQNAIYWPTMWISENLRISKHQILKIKIKKSIVKCKLVISTINKTYYKLFSVSEHFPSPRQSLVHVAKTPFSHSLLTFFHQHKCTKQCSFITTFVLPCPRLLGPQRERDYCIGSNLVWCLWIWYVNLGTPC
jgi:hypothetical protein